MASSTDTKANQITVRCQFCQSWNRVDASRVSDRPQCGTCHRPLLLDRPVPLTDADFQRTIEGSEIPVLVDFYADWCGPCKMMAPVVDDLAGRFQGRVLVGKLDTDAAQETAGRFNIRAIPTTILFKDGHEVARHTGAAGARVLEELIGKAQQAGGKGQ
ncbi:MAG TPA: thioredoxin [Gemmatimonadaceae bacterium]|nr:thioredoxin [Gemmatimonadaceae bacterium]